MERFLLRLWWLCFSYLYLSKGKRTTCFFFTLYIIWWGGRAGLMRQIANLLTVVRRSGGSNPLPIALRQAQQKLFKNKRLIWD